MLHARLHARLLPPQTTLTEDCFDAFLRSIGLLHELFLASPLGVSKWLHILSTVAEMAHSIDNDKPILELRKLYKKVFPAVFERTKQRSKLKKSIYPFPPGSADEENF